VGGTVDLPFALPCCPSGEGAWSRDVPTPISAPACLNTQYHDGGSWNSFSQCAEGNEFF